MVLGRFAPEEPAPQRYTLADAVEAWKVARGVVAQGIDPLSVSVPAGENGEPGPPVVETLTGVPPAHHERALQIFGTEPLKSGSFGELARDYMALHAWVEKRRTRDDELMLMRDLLPRWRDEPATAITRARMVQLLDDIVRRLSGMLDSAHISPPSPQPIDRTPECNDRHGRRKSASLW